MSTDDLNIVDDRLKQFERNKYFYGRLMSVSDFTDEQAYFNEKRYLINRFVHGEGIICGLQVVSLNTDDWSVVLSSGVALDCHGREIVVSKNNDVQLVSTSKINPSSPIEIPDNSIGLFIKRKDDGIDPVPAPSTSGEGACTPSKIQENFELYFDYVPETGGFGVSAEATQPSDKKSKAERMSFQSSDIFFRDCPYCKGRSPSVLLAVLVKATTGWQIDPTETVQNRKTIRTWFNDKIEETQQFGPATVDSTTGIVDFDYPAGANMLFGPIEHHLKSTIPPLVSLGKAADNTNVEFVEDYGLCGNDKPPVCFKAVNINPVSFMIRLDAKTAGRISIRWWANLAKDRGRQELKPLVKPTIQFSSAQYSLDDSVTITITDPQASKAGQLSSVNVTVSTSSNPTGSTIEAWEIGPGGGVFNAKVPVSSLTKRAPDTLIAVYPYKVQGRPETIQTTAKLTSAQKPTISFASPSYTLYDTAAIMVNDNRRLLSPSPTVSIQISSNKNPQPILLDAKFLPSPSTEGITYVARIRVTNITKTFPDKLVATYSYQVGDKTEQVAATADISNLSA